MAEIVLGMWTTHGPTLNATPDRWGERVKADDPVERRSGEDIAACAFIRWT
ncbi:MAG: hypothetical protein OYH76_22470 [Defluviicoccus sp.]|nr:hypothetical protein [Defluviicoccus sp.]MDE0278670.1 hypothetical protein [Defluviicoccus sp.]